MFAPAKRITMFGIFFQLVVQLSNQVLKNFISGVG
jgi:hypothetical protein